MRMTRLHLERDASDFFDAKTAFVRQAKTARQYGMVARITGLAVEARGLFVPIGARCCIEGFMGENIQAEVVGFRGDVTLLLPLSEVTGIRSGDRIVCEEYEPRIRVGMGLLGRVVNAMGHPIDGFGPLHVPYSTPLYREAPDPMQRRRVREPLVTGIRAIDACLTVGKGQRMGIFAGSGIGKSTMLGMITRYTEADVTVIGLVGERGREVRDFLDKDLGAAGLRKATVVVATSDEAAVNRVRAANTATAIAEHYRDNGLDVLLLMDSVTRVAMAQREIGLAAGEPPANKGYTPSVFASLPRLLERSGQAEEGSITAFYAVLVEADDVNEPISDAVRSILDGHVWLSRTLADQGHYPAVDLLGSISRLMPDIVDGEHAALARNLRRNLARYRENEDLIHIGAYVQGSNADVDEAIRCMPGIRTFLQQDIAETTDYETSLRLLKVACRQLEQGDGA